MLLTKDWQLKLTDFGEARAVNLNQVADDDERWNADLRGAGGDGGGITTTPLRTLTASVSTGWP